MTFLPRRTLVVLAFLWAGLTPAFALSLMDPFNIPGTMDGGVVRLGQDIAYAEGERGKLDVYAPENGLEKKAPVLVFLYGGAWKQGVKEDYVFIGHAFAARGFVTVIPDYRLVPEVQYPAFLDDNAEAIKWVETNIERYGGDPDRIYVLGHSAGAYNAVMLGMDPAYLRDAGVTKPLRGVAALSGPFAVYPFEVKELQDAFGNTDNPQMTQPINLPVEQSVPLFLGHGDIDLIVSVDNTRRMEKKFHDEGNSIDVKIYEGLGHMEAVMALSNVWRWRSTLRDDIVAFFERNGAFDPESFGPIDLVGVVDGTKETAVDAADDVAASPSGAQDAETGR
jgi:acetyl esterase/lipase